jgi:hypothetical protein
MNLINLRVKCRKNDVEVTPDRVASTPEIWFGLATQTHQRALVQPGFAKFWLNLLRDAANVPKKQKRLVPPSLFPLFEDSFLCE